MLGERLFTRVGRRLVPTEVGQVVFRYADEIFTLGRELVDTVRGRTSGRPMRLVVGVADVVSKLIAYRLLAPALGLANPIRIICREDRADALLASLAVHELNLVLSDSPVPPTVHVKAYNHLLGECGVTVFAAPALASKLRRRFPASLAGAPMLLPADGTVLRRQLEGWFEKTGIRPAIVGEFDDSALMKVFGENGAGAFAAPSAIAGEIREQYRVTPIGQVEEIRERFYAISVERRITHPAIAAIAQGARTEIFLPGPTEPQTRTPATGAPRAGTRTGRPRRSTQTAAAAARVAGGSADLPGSDAGSKAAPDRGSRHGARGMGLKA